MPLYEFRCNTCRGRTSVLTKSVGDVPTPICDNCGGGDLSRIISSFAYHRSIQDVWDHSGSPDKPGPDYYKDPRNIGRWAENKFQQMGEEMPGQIKDMIQAAREGDLPDSVKDLQPGVKEI